MAAQDGKQTPVERPDLASARARVAVIGSLGATGNQLGQQLTTVR